MKKMNLLFLFTILLLTGCGANKLVCTKTDDSANLNVESKYTFYYRDDAAYKASLKVTTTLLGNLNVSENIAVYQQSAETYASEYNDIDGIEAKVSSYKNKITLSVELTSASMKEEDKETYALNKSKEYTKKELEEEGYTCQ